MDEGLQLRLDALREHVRHAWMAKQDDMAFEHLTDDCRNEILRDKLWIGDFVDQHILPYPHVKAIVSLGGYFPEYTTHENIEYHRIIIEDAPDKDLYQHFDAACDFIEKHINLGNQVLVHCQAGVSRSATICMAYLMKKVGLTFIQAYACVKEARPVASPNWGFVEQLLKYEMELRKKK